MNRAERQQEVDRLSADLQEIRHAVLIDYKGISVPQVTELRQKVRACGGRYKVVKNRLLGLAVTDAPLGKLAPFMKGPTAVAWSADQPVALAKVLTEFAKTVPVVKFKGALLDGESIAVGQLEAVANLPSKDVLRAQLLGLLVSPMRRFVTVLAGPSRNFVSVLKQKADKN